MAQAGPYAPIVQHFTPAIINQNVARFKLTDAQVQLFTPGLALNQMGASKEVIALLINQNVEMGLRWLNAGAPANFMIYQKSIMVKVDPGMQSIQHQVAHNTTVTTAQAHGDIVQGKINRIDLVLKKMLFFTDFRFEL